MEHRRSGSVISQASTGASLSKGKVKRSSVMSRQNSARSRDGSYRDSGRLLKAKLDVEQINECKAVYLAVIGDLDDFITSVEELILMLQYCGRNPSRRSVLKYWSEDTDALNFDIFCNIVQQEKAPERNALLRAFHRIDVNDDGYISFNELSKILTKHGERMTKAEVKALMDDADYNNDGKLDYEEFCKLMMMTSSKVQRLHQQKDSGENKRPKSGLGKKFRGSSTSLNSGIADQSISRGSPIEERDDEQVAPQKKILKEPQDLLRWHYNSSKGCFFMSEDGTVESHHYRMKVPRETQIWLSIQALKPKYGKISSEVLDSDITVFIVSIDNGIKLEAFSECKIEENYCLSTTLDAGVYEVLTFTSGCKLKQGLVDGSSPQRLVKGSGEDMVFTKACRDSLYEIFYRCDLDGNGYLSRDEFSQFQVKTAGEEIDDDAWEVMQENFEMNGSDEITADGFVKLNLMEAQDPDGGGPNELWITLESMGYTKGLELAKACPFHIQLFSKSCKCTLDVVGVSDAGKPLEIALKESIKASSMTRPLKGKRDLSLYSCINVTRTTLAVENKSHNGIVLELDCVKSSNLTSNRTSLRIKEDVEPREMKIFHHLVPTRVYEPTRLSVNETVLK